RLVEIDLVGLGRSRRPVGRQPVIERPEDLRLVFRHVEQVHEHESLAVAPVERARGGPGELRGDALRVAEPQRPGCEREAADRTGAAAAGERQPEAEAKPERPAEVEVSGPQTTRSREEWSSTESSPARAGSGTE